MIAHAALKFDYSSSVAEFAISKHSYLVARPEASFGYIATSTLVLDTTVASEPRVLLLQRAATDSDPNKWEPPGGACDDDDLSILHGAARELQEEASLQVDRFYGHVGVPHFFTLSDGKKVCQFNFIAQVKGNSGAMPQVHLDPEEHQNFVWATEDDVKARSVHGLELTFTRSEVEQTVLQAFDYFKAARDAKEWKFDTANTTDTAST